MPEYWIIDLDARVVERWRPADERPDIIADVLTRHPRTDVQPLSIRLDEFFLDVVD